MAACAADDAPEPSVDAGYPTGDGVPDADQSAAFDDVHPILLAKCGDCHGASSMNVTKFVSPDLAATYAAITNETALVGNFAAFTAPVLTKIEPMHQAITYTTAEIAAITVWLDDEVATRFPATVNPGSGEVPPSVVTSRRMTAYQDCLITPDAQEVGGWMTTPDPVHPAQPCDNCHATAGYGFLASLDASFFNTILRQNQQLIAQYYIVDLSSGVANARVVVNSANFERVASRQGPHADHPPFDVSATSPGLAAIAAAYVDNCPQ